MRRIVKKILVDKRINILTILLLVFSSLLVIFPAGALHPSTAIENTSEYLADVASNHTQNGKYVAMMVEPKDGSEKKINNPYTEFHYLYGIFREGMATYAGTANSDKSHSIKFKDINDDSVNFSFLNVDSGFETQKYYKDTDGNMVYKQEFYPLELMFYSNHPKVPGTHSFLYLSQSRANCLLNKKGLEHTRENYQSLLNTLITLEFDGVEYKYAIDNIYFERNYFYNALNEVMGEFFLGGAGYYPGGIKRQGVFFLRNYAYQNKYYIKYATSLYSEEDFLYKVLNYNFHQDFKVDDSKVVLFSYGSAAGAILLLGLSIVMILCALVLMLFGSYQFTIANISLVVGALLIPYSVFWTIHLFTKSAILFSTFSINAEMWCILSFIVISFFLFMKKRSYKIKMTK